MPFDALQNNEVPTAPFGVHSSRYAAGLLCAMIALTPAAHAAEIDTDRVQQAARPISLQYCIAAAMKENPDILVQAFDPQAAEEALIQQRGAFDPVASLNASLSGSETDATEKTWQQGLAATQSASTAETDGFQWDASIGGLLPWGMSYSVGYARQDSDTSSDGSSAGYPGLDWSGGQAATPFAWNPFRNGFENASDQWTFRLTQPLLRGRGLANNLANIRIARSQRLRSNVELKRVANDTAQRVILAYWDFTGALENQRVREESLKNSRRILQTNEIRFKAGAAALPDVQQAQASVAGDEAALRESQSAAYDAQDALLTLMGPNPASDAARQALLPEDQPVVRQEALSETACIETALKNRLELQAIDLNIEIQYLEEARRANATLPRVDLVAEVNLNQDRGTARTQAGLSPLEREHSTQDGAGYRIGVTGSMPIGNRAARAAYRQTVIERRRAEQCLANAKQQITWDVLAAVREVRTRYEVAKKCQERRDLARANLAAEEKRLNRGAATSLDVLQMQEKLTQAELSEVQARIGCEKARTQLDHTQGALLEKFKIAVQ